MLNFTAMNVDLPSSWVKFQPHLCESCAAYCCTMPVEINFQDLIRLELATEGESPKRVAERLKKMKIVKNYRAATGLFQLEQKSDRGCVFLDKERKCAVYEKRPDVCRKFPTIGPRPGFCPYGRKN